MSSDGRLSVEDVQIVHPDYPTPIPQVNLLYEEHAERVKAHFQGQP